MSQRFKPLRITWGLTSPLVTSGNPIHLDALVAYAKTQQALAELAFSGSADEPMSDRMVRDLAADLPLAKARQGDDWVWQASAVLALPGAVTSRGMRFWTRKTDPYDIANRTELGQFESLAERDRRLAGKVIKPKKPLKPYAGKVDLERGMTKNMYKFFPVNSIRQVQAWCIGDPDELHALLAPESGYLTHIGPRKRSGHGAIDAFEIVEDDSARELWAQRVLPWPHEGAVEMNLASRPPYWAAENRGVCYVQPSVFM